MGKNLGSTRLLCAAMIAGALALAPAVSAEAAQAAPAAVHVATVKVVSYKNCTALHKTYKGGVAKSGVKYNKVSGKNRAFTVRPTFNTALYNANKKLDRDKDGIACEKG